MLRFPFPEAPNPGQLIDVAPHVRWLRMPLPFALNHINLWVLDDGDALTLIDTGVDTPITRELWRGLFAGQLAGKPVKRLICTHFHPDHMGLAAWLYEEFSIPVHMTAKELAAASIWHGSSSLDIANALTTFFVRGGFDPAIAQGFVGQRQKFPKLVSGIPEGVIMIDPSAPISAAQGQWRIIIGEGHAPELVTLFNEKLGVLISSDQVLPKISPNISVNMLTSSQNPLQLFLDGFERFRSLPEDTLVLPSHRLPFIGLHERMAELIAHHHDRLALGRRACAQPTTAQEVMVQLFPQKLDAHTTFFALGETLAHLHYLMGTGEVVCEARSDGVDLYRTLAA